MKFGCGTGGLSAAAQGEDEMEDGARRDVEFACGLFVWPVGTQREREGKVKEGKGARIHRDQRTSAGHRR